MRPRAPPAPTTHSMTAFPAATPQGPPERGHPGPCSSPRPRPRPGRPCMASRRPGPCPPWVSAALLPCLHCSCALCAGVCQRARARARARERDQDCESAIVRVCVAASAPSSCPAQANRPPGPPSEGSSVPCSQCSRARVGAGHALCLGTLRPAGTCTGHAVHLGPAMHHRTCHWSPWCGARLQAGCLRALMPAAGSRAVDPLSGAHLPSSLQQGACSLYLPTSDGLHPQSGCLLLRDEHSRPGTCCPAAAQLALPAAQLRDLASAPRQQECMRCRAARELCLPANEAMGA